MHVGVQRALKFMCLRCVLCKANNMIGRSNATQKKTNQTSNPTHQTNQTKSVFIRHSNKKQTDQTYQQTKKKQTSNQTLKQKNNQAIKVQHVFEKKQDMAVRGLQCWLRESCNHRRHGPKGPSRRGDKACDLHCLENWH